MTERSVVPPQFKHMVSCTKCALSKTRTNVVVGSGSTRKARYILIGEAPGREEDEEGLPFIGASGRKLRGLMEEVGLSPTDFYITNIIKCRPPGNRKPTVEEIKACSVHLNLQMSFFGSKTIVVVGNTSLQYFIPDKKITMVHGQYLTSKRGKIIFPIIHPAAALRNREWEDLIRQDLAKLAEGDRRAPATDIFAPRTIG